MTDTAPGDEDGRNPDLSHRSDLTHEQAQSDAEAAAAELARLVVDVVPANYEADSGQ